MTRRPLSLAARVTLLFGIAATLVMPAFGWFIDRAIDNHFLAEDTRELNIIADAARRVLETTPANHDPNTLAQRLQDLLVGHHSASLYVATAAGSAVFGSINDELTPLLTTTQTIPAPGTAHQWAVGDNAYRGLVQRQTATGGYTIAVAVPIAHHVLFLNGFRQTLATMIACSIALLGLLGWVAVRRGHKPLHAIVAQIRRISADRLDSRIAPEDTPTELTDLAHSFNEMLARVEEAFTRLSNYSADIAHELRTPVANLMAQTQVALSQPRSSEQYREVLYSNVEELERMAQMIGDMLFLAKAENGLEPPHVIDVDLAHELHELFDYYDAWAEARGVKLQLTGAASVRGDKLMLRRALGNLLSNAIRHTPIGLTVQIRIARPDSETVTIDIENPGATIAAEHLPNLFDRFYRIDPSRQRSGEGAGLGLAIVKSIVEAHFGRVAVHSADGVTRFSIALPHKPSATHDGARGN